MSDYFQYNDPLLITWRTGDPGDEYVSIIETNLKIVHNKIILREIPSKFDKVQIPGYAEIFSGTPTAGQFITDYSLGICTFDASQNGVVLSSISYKGRGQISYPAERIYVHNPSSDIYTNLQDLIDTIQNLDAEGVATKFDPSIGHTHSGAPGDAPPITHIQVLVSDPPIPTDGEIWLMQS